MARLYDTTEAAPLLGLTDARGVQALCRAEAIDHYRFESPGGRVRYRLDQGQIDAYLAKHRVKPSI